MLKCFEEGKDEKDIIDLFEGDKQLVGIWRAFLIHNDWMSHPDGKWLVNDKGKEWIRKFGT